MQLEQHQITIDRSYFKVKSKQKENPKDCRDDGWHRHDKDAFIDNSIFKFKNMIEQFHKSGINYKLDDRKFIEEIKEYFIREINNPELNHNKIDNILNYLDEVVVRNPRNTNYEHSIGHAYTRKIYF